MSVRLLQRLSSTKCGSRSAGLGRNCSSNRRPNDWASKTTGMPDVSSGSAHLLRRFLGRCGHTTANSGAEIEKTFLYRSFSIAFISGDFHTGWICSSDLVRWNFWSFRWGNFFKKAATTCQSGREIGIKHSNLSVKNRCMIWNCAEQTSNFISDKNPFLSGALTYDFITRELFDW
jgi:hypothetical protein